MLTEFQNCLTKYQLLWQSESGASLHLPSRLTFTQWVRQVSRYIRSRHRLVRICDDLENQPDCYLTNNREIMPLVSSWLQIDAAGMDEQIRHGYVNCTETFIRMVRDRWPALDQASIFQALRNIWIMNVIQTMTDQPVELTDAMFAYSMLYPLSDNWLDSHEISEDEKAVFSERFGQRLCGLKMVPGNRHESDVFSMIDLIEGQYSRTENPEVYQSLLLIHQAQCASLRQQGHILTTNDLIQLSFEKGAASVVADGCLVLGRLSAAEIDFLTGYGIVLQLADDLQDMDEDIEHKHHTLFTDADTSSERWANIQALLYLSEISLQKLCCRNDWLQEQIRMLLGQSIRLLIGDAIYSQRSFFAKNQIKMINAQHPVGLRRHAILKRMLEDELPVFQRQYGQSG